MSITTSAIQSLLQQKMLLEIEYNAEKDAFRQLTEQMGLARKVKRGDAWYPLKPGRTYYNSLNQHCIEVMRTGDDEIEHNFEFGRPVVFFRVVDKKLKFIGYTGTVSYVDGDRMVVVVPDTPRPRRCSTARSPWACSCRSTRPATR